MTTLYKDQPYECKFSVGSSGTGIVTVCDKQCAKCKNVKLLKTK